MRFFWGFVSACAIVIVICMFMIFNPHCAQATQVDFSLTLPNLRADSLNCQIASSDSLKNLGTIAMYVSTTSALTDSVLVISANVAGQEGKQFLFSAQQPAGTTRWYWGITRDLLDRRACKSNVISKTTGIGPPWRILDLRVR